MEQGLQTATVMPAEKQVPLQEPGKDPPGQLAQTAPGPCQPGLGRRTLVYHSLGRPRGARDGGFVRQFPQGIPFIQIPHHPVPKPSISCRGQGGVTQEEGKIYHSLPAQGRILCPGLTCFLHRPIPPATRPELSNRPAIKGWSAWQACLMETCRGMGNSFPINGINLPSLLPTYLKSRWRQTGWNGTELQGA